MGEFDYRRIYYCKMHFQTRNDWRGKIMEQSLWSWLFSLQINKYLLMMEFSIHQTITYLVWCSFFFHFLPGGGWISQKHILPTFMLLNFLDNFSNDFTPFVNSFSSLFLGQFSTFSRDHRRIMITFIFLWFYALLWRIQQ